MQGATREEEGESLHPDDVHEWRRRHVPVYGPDRMKLGVFGTNVSHGCTITMAETSFRPTFEHNLAIARRAESLGFELLVPVGRWRGFGGPTDFNGTCLEVYTWAAALAARTERIMLFATSHVPTVHPIVAAKQGATIDQISGGRFGLNIVCGWFTPEMEMFGAKQMGHDERYRYAGEWLTVVKRLWTEQGFDHHGESFTIQDGYLLPKPVQQPHPVLINAGSSPAGREFSAQHVDFNFITMDSLETGRELVRDVHARARAHGRDVGVMSYGLVCCRDSEREARALYDHIVERGDWEATKNIMDVLGVQSGSFDAQVKRFAERFIAGWGGYPLVGTPEQVVEEMVRASEAGIEGLILSWLDYHEELGYFGERVLPLMRQAGLRC
jgi:alkanesulfonate monooxygenase SsuD/methylene tetrahydromethanopterin reductase-like flavin-dependent oxidoreductase (luciferase family)